MSDFVEPGKEAVRSWLQRRQRAEAPPPPIEQIRDELGWQRAPARVPPVVRKPVRGA